MHRYLNATPPPPQKKDKCRFFKSPGSELRSCVKVKVAIVGSLSLIVCMVSVDEQQQFKKPMFFRDQFGLAVRC